MKDIRALTAVIVNLKALSDGDLPATHGHMIYGAFLRTVSSYSQELSESLHNPSPEKPFTLSGLRGGGLKRGRKADDMPDAPVIPIVAGGRYRIRITSLSASLSLQLLDMFEKIVGSYLNIGGIPFCIVDWDITEHKRAGTASYEELTAACLDAGIPHLDRFGWSFLSATTIHSGGRNLLFPDPSAIFPRLAARWNFFCPEAARLPHGNNKDFGTLVGKSLMPSANQLHTHMLDFGDKGRQIGFTGYIEFHPDKNADSGILKLLHLLGCFSFFSGVGYATTKGLGQVDFILP